MNYVQRSVSTRATPGSESHKRKGFPRSVEEQSPTLQSQHKRARKIKTHDD